MRGPYHLHRKQRKHFFLQPFLGHDRETNTDCFEDASHASRHGRQEASERSARARFDRPVLLRRH